MPNKNTDNFSQTQLLSVPQAAEYLGVHAATVRRWAYAKRLKGSKIGIRGDWRFTEADLLKIAHLNDIVDTVPISDPSHNLPSVSRWDTIGDTSHIVQFYEDDAFLIKSIKQFIQSGDAAIVVAAPMHKENLEKGLKMFGLDVSAAYEKGAYICLDAAETLSKFMVDGLPDSNLFFEVIGGLITRVSRNKKKMRIFGEMVALLCAEGNQEAAITLEELWNEMQSVHSFTLFCAYPLHAFGEDSHAISFEKISTTHSHVIPAESYSALIDEDKRSREIAVLQQKAHIMETEITKRKETEVSLLRTLRELKMSEEFNRSIIENSVDRIEVLNLDGRLLSCNGSGCAAMEIDNFQQFLGKDWLSFWNNEYYVDAKKAFEKAKKGGIGRFQGFCPTVNGTQKWWDVVISPIFSDIGHVQRLVSVSRDITAIKELEQRKEDFLSATSHELKTPLTSQKAFIQLLQQQIKKNREEKYSLYVTKINEQTDKLTKLVSDLLDVSKVQGGKLILDSTPFDMNACVKECVEEIQTIADKHTITIKGKIERKVFGDKEKISQVIINLLTNAVKYSPHSTKIAVLLESDKSYATISVHDFGIGIDKNDQRKVFDRFYRVSNDKTYPGLGMGLYIASEIVKQHRGKIWVTSEKEKGSIFSFIIPLN